MSMRIVPESQQPSSTSSIAYGEVAPSAPGLPDTMRTQEGPLSASARINGRHPLENRVANWEKTQESMKMEQYRRLFGSAAPIKRQMDLSILEVTDFKPAQLGGASNIHRDIIMNKETSVDWEDVYDDFNGGMKPQADFHTELERKMGI